MRMKTKNYLIVILMALMMPVGTWADVGTFDQKVGDKMNPITLTYTVEYTSTIAVITGFTVTSGVVANLELEIPSSCNINETSYNIIGIGENAFKDKTILKTVKIPASIIDIGESAFEGCTNLTAVGSLTTKDLQIGSSAFKDCTKLANIVIPSRTSVVGANAFYGCNSSQGGPTVNITKPSTTLSSTTIADNLLNGQYVKNIVLGSGITTIGQGAFKDISNLSSVTLPASLTTIGATAFQGCTSLTSVDIPANVTSIGDNAFDCGNTLDVYVNRMVPIDIPSGTDPFPNRTVTGHVLHAPFGVSSSYANHAYWGTFASVQSPATYTASNGIVYGWVGDGTYHLNVCGWEGWTSPQNVTIADHFQFGDSEYTVTEIRYEAFKDCAFLDAIEIPSSITKISINAFLSSGLRSVTFHEGLEIIDNNAVNNTKLTTVNIPSTVSAISSGAFNNCDDLESAYLLGQITYLPNQIFQNCSNLVTVILPPILQTIDQSAFSGCINLERIELPASLTSMRAAVFKECTKLKDVIFRGMTPPVVDTSFNGDLFVLGDAQSHIDRSTVTLHVPFGAVGYSSPDSYWSDFNIDMAPGEVADYQTVKYSCRFNSDGTGYAEVTGIYDSSVTSITIMGSVNNYVGDELMAFPVIAIAKDAFAGNSSLSTVSIPASVNTIGIDAFKDCTSLNKVIVTTNMTEFPQLAFSSSNAYQPLKFDLEVNLGQNSNIVMAFATGCKNIKSVTIGDGVTTIGPNAFADCTSMTSVVIPNSVTTIGAKAFGIANPNYTSPLTDVTVQWTTPPTSINGNNDPFPSDKSGITLHVPTGTESSYSGDSYWSQFNIVGPSYDYEYKGVCYQIIEGTTTAKVLAAGTSDLQLSEVPLLDDFEVDGVTYTVTEIEPEAFMGNASVEHLLMPIRLTTIGNNAFADCENLKVIAAGPAIATIGEGAFSNTLVTLYIIGDMTDMGIPEGAYQGKDFLRSVDIAKLVKLGNYGFEGLPIGANAFKNCTNLESVTISECLLSSIGSGAFDGCTSLSEVKVDWTQLWQSYFPDPRCLPNTVAADAFDQGTYENGRLLVPAGYKDLYAETAPWSNFNHIVSIIDFADAYVRNLCLDENTGWDTDHDLQLSTDEAAAVTNLSQVFRGNTDIKKFQELRYFTGLTEIGVSDFEGCTSLEIVELPTSVTKILTKAFYGCSSLQGISGGYQFLIPVQVTSIGEEAFANCKPASRIQIFGPAVIGARAFAGSLINSSESQVYITSALNSIATDAFDETGALFYINSSNDTPIGVWLFKDCTFLKNLSVNAPIGISAFDGCTNLESVFFSDDVTSIGGTAFRGCSQLQSVELPWTLQTVSSGAFGECTSLSKLTINAQVTSIEQYAFASCPALQTIIVKAATPPALVQNAFVVYNNATLFVPEESAQAYASALPWSKFNKRGVVDSQGIRYTYAMVDGSPKATVVGYKGWADDLVIAGSIKGHDGQVYPVKEINTYPAFELAGNYFMSITIPASMTTILEWAFAENVNLKTVKVGWSDPTDLSIIPRIFNWTPINPNPDDPENTNGEGILYVPAGTTDLYQSTAPWSYFKTFIEYQPGNANGDDNTIDINDVLAIVDYILGKNVPATFNAAAADVNGDGRVTIADAAAVVNIILGMGN